MIANTSQIVNIKKYDSNFVKIFGEKVDNNAGKHTYTIKDGELDIASTTVYTKDHDGTNAHHI
jgi:hypothetical protein